jgi:hypothetical protein
MRYLALFLFFIPFYLPCSFAEDMNYAGIWKDDNSESYLSIQQNGNIIISSRILWPDKDNLPSTTTIFSSNIPVLGVLEEDSDTGNKRVELKSLDPEAPQSFSVFIFTSENTAIITASPDPFNFFNDIPLSRIF